MKKASATLRLAAMFALVALAAFTLMGAALYAVLYSQLQRQQTDVLNTTANDVFYSLSRIGTPDRWARLKGKMDTLASSDTNLKFWVLSPDPDFSYGELVPPGAGAVDGFSSLTLPGSSDPMRTLTRTASALGERPEVKFIVGIDMKPYLHTLHTFVVALAGLLLLAVLATVALGWWIARAAYRDSLGRLEAAYRQLEAFNADVAHELRTPLTNLIGQTQVALSRRRAAPELEEVLQSNLEDLDQLRAIVNDMLFLARADQGEVARALEPTVLADEVNKTIEFFEFVLDDLGLAVAVEGDTQARAGIERAQFRRAMSNLLQNAIQHTRGGTRIAVDIRAREDGTVSIAVTNQGARIDARHLPHLFDRFYRVDAARHDGNAVHGHGLGLAIVQAVARMHGGAVFASSAQGATTIGFSVKA